MRVVSKVIESVHIIFSRAEIDSVVADGRAEMEPTVFVRDRSVISSMASYRHSHTGYVNATRFRRYPTFYFSEWRGVGKILKDAD